MTDYADDNNVLTFEKLQQALDKLTPPLYFQTTTWLGKGDIYHCQETEFSPECLIFHPDDEPLVREKITARRLVPLADEPKEAQMERLQRQIEKELRKTFNEMFK